MRGDGRKLNHTTLEQICIRAVRQIQAGAHPEEVAAGLGMNRSTIFGWLAKACEGGEAALKAKPVPGSPAKVSASQMSRIYALIAGNDPRQLQFDVALWTRDIIRDMIAREFGVSLSSVSVGRLLKSMGLSAQRSVSHCQ